MIEVLRGLFALPGFKAAEESPHAKLNAQQIQLFADGA
jgi:hypothetical protein